MLLYLIVLETLLHSSIFHSRDNVFKGQTLVNSLSYKSIGSASI